MSITHELKCSLYKLLKEDRQSSHATHADRRQILNHAAAEIVKLGYKITDIHQLKQKHVADLARHWKEEKLSNGTIKNRLSVLRHLARLLDKPQLIPGNTDLQIGRRHYIPVVSRAIINPDLSGIKNPYVRVSLELQRHFGLRREESLKIRPFLADQGHKLVLLGAWCKGNRGREIQIRTDAQRQWLDEAKKLAWRADRSLIPESKSYIQHRYVYDKQLQKAGIRSHGLRHAYAQQRYKELTGWEAPIVGGPTQKDFDYEQRHADLLARMILTEELGHSRIQITKNYLA